MEQSHIDTSIYDRIGVVDLFCGIGGLTYGLRKAGLNVLAGIDLDESCRFAYEENNKGSRFICANIKEITAEALRAQFDQCETRVLVGCAPCQPFSSHRKDKRHRNLHKDWGLLGEFSRLVREIQPDFVSMENVPALAKESIFTEFLDTLQEFEYSIDWRVVKTEDYGVPQKRRRLILLAAKNHIAKIETAEEFGAELVSVKDAIGDLPKVAAGAVDPKDSLHSASALTGKNLKRIQASRPNGTWREWPKQLQLDCHKKPTGKTYPGVYGRMSWDEPAPTITTQFYCYGTGRYGHPEQDRALTLREGAILQSFPKTYKFTLNTDKISRKLVARHIGNAVPPKLGEVVGRSIIDALGH